MDTYEIFDSNPAETGGSRWDAPIKARSIAGATRKAKRILKGNPEYREGTTLWYVRQSAAGEYLGQGTITI